QASWGRPRRDNTGGESVYSGTVKGSPQLLPSSYSTLETRTWPLDCCFFRQFRSPRPCDSRSSLSQGVGDCPRLGVRSVHLPQADNILSIFPERRSRFNRTENVYDWFS